MAVINEGGFNEALQVLGKFGRAGRSRFHNVLLLKAPEARQLCEALRLRLAGAPGSLAFLSRLLPVEMTWRRLVTRLLDGNEAASLKIKRSNPRLGERKGHFVPF